MLPSQNKLTKNGFIHLTYIYTSVQTSDMGSQHVAINETLWKLTQCVRLRSPHIHSLEFVACPNEKQSRTELYLNKVLYKMIFLENIHKGVLG